MEKLMLDLTAVRMFYLKQVPDAPFTLEMQRALTCTVLDYAYRPTGQADDGMHLCEGETAYILESFGYDIGTLNLTQRQFLTGLLPHYSMASKHPILVGEIFRTLMDCDHRQRVMAKFPQLAGI